MKNKYEYNGPVTSFDKIMSDHWKASTYAVSEAKARSNFKYQFKLKHNLVSGAKIELPGKISMVS